MEGHSPDGEYRNRPPVPGTATTGFDGGVVAVIGTRPGRRGSPVETGRGR